jgi:hypothetical protein
MSRHDMRRENRRNCTQPVGIMWRDSAGDDKFIQAPVRDISASGVALEIPEPVPVRSFVTLCAEKLGIHGQASVRYCSRQGIKYSIGMQFTGGTRWKTEEEQEEVAAHASGGSAADRLLTRA